MAVVIRNVLLIASLVVPVLTVPTFQPASTETCSLKEQASRRTSITPFKRIRNSIIETIWNIPKESTNPPKYIRTHQTAPSNFRRKYDNDIVLRFTINTEDEATAFSKAASILYLDIWDSTDEWVDVRIAKKVLPSFLGLLPTSLQNSYTPLMHDLAQAVYDTYPSAPEPVVSWRGQKHQVPSNTYNEFFLDYQPLSIIYPWLRLQSSLYHPGITELISLGTTPEGRDIPALHIKVRSDTSSMIKPRKTILLTAGSHAREWISVSTINYITDGLLGRYKSPHYPDVKKFLKHYDVIVIPVLNPDGYEYTWSTDRLWRKTRQSNSIPFCPGLDLDRSFPFNWDGHLDSDDPCTEYYAGTSPLEAIEAQLLANWTKNFIDTKQGEIVAYLDLHSYSQQILYPYSYSCRARPPTIEDLQEVAQSLAKDFRLTNGQFYGIVSACKAALLSSSNPSKHDGSGGTMLDWFYHDMKVRHAYSIKLRDTGTYGFLLPKENIVPSGREALEAVVGLGRWLIEHQNVNQEEENGDIVEEEEGEKEESTIKEHIRHEAVKNVENDNENENEEWERIYDPDFELKRRK